MKKTDRLCAQKGMQMVKTTCMNSEWVISIKNEQKNAQKTLLHVQIFFTINHKLHMR